MDEAFLGNCIVHWYEQKTGSLFLQIAELPLEKSDFLPHKNPLVKMHHQSAQLPTLPLLHEAVGTWDGAHWHPTHIPCAFWCLPVCPWKEGWSGSPSEWRKPWGTTAPSVQSCLCFLEIFQACLLYIKTAKKGYPVKPGCTDKHCLLEIPIMDLRTILTNN